MKKKTAKKTRSHKTKSNPHRFGGVKKRSHRRRSSNPGLFAGTSSILKSGFYALVGLVATRQIPQMVLGAQNTGIMGYLANIAVTVVGAMIAGKMFGSEVAKAFGIGGGIYTVNRVLTDNMSPVGKVLSLSGIGDYTALGDIQPGYFPLPVPTNGAGQPIIPAELQPRMIAAAMTPGVSGVARSTRYNSRF
jgi:uncharacterized membrane protein YuzA (DUF378 family)